MKQEKPLNYTEIKSIFNLLKMVDGTDSAKIADVAKEGGWRKTELMQFILDNKDLFGTEMSYNSKCNPAGLVITAIYENAIENPESDAWLEMMKEKHERTIEIFQRVSMSNFSGWNIKYVLMIDQDEKKSQYWNTREKFNKIKDLLDKTMGEKVNYDQDIDGQIYALSTTDKIILDILKENNWNIIFRK